MPQPPLPPQAAFLAPLVGHWVGEGEGLWTADPRFRYREEVTFAATGKAFLAYQQRTQAIDDARPLHAEAGYLRASAEGEVELLIVQPTGFAEIHTGTFDGAELTVRLAQLTHTPTALPVTDVLRHFRVAGETLTYQLQLAMNGESLADHLRGTLVRSAPPALSG
ncbi:MAG: heme-binding beta-barrel domain-containing protein [Mycobacteriales bacterium]